jgi:hypothetical protein
MKKSILTFKGAIELTRKEQKSINGGNSRCCSEGFAVINASFCSNPVNLCRMF